MFYLLKQNALVEARALFPHVLATANKRGQRGASKQGDLKAWIWVVILEKGWGIEVKPCADSYSRQKPTQTIKRSDSTKVWETDRRKGEAYRFTDW